MSSNSTAKVAQSDQSSIHDAGGTRWRWFAAAVLGFAAVLLFARLGTRALWSSEFRWGEIAREMLISHNFFWPTINGKVYYDKPLGSYWLIVASTWLTGSMNEAAARIPSAIAGLLAVILVIVIGRRLYDLRTGTIAGIVLATSFSFVFWARSASADVETIAGELAAIALFLRYEKGPRHSWVVALWLIMAVTSLTKGLLGFVLPLVVLGSYSCVAHGWSELRTHALHGSLATRGRWIVDRFAWFFNWWTVVAIALAGIVYYAPFAISHAQTGSSKGLYMVYRENVERFFEPFDHRGPLYLYAYAIFALMAPWSAFLPAALMQMHGRLRRDPDHARSDRLVLAFFWSTFIFFSLSGSRRNYYLLPILPAAAVMISRLLTQPRETLFEWPRRLMTIGYLIIAGIAVLSALAFLPPRWFLPSPWNQLPDAPDRLMFALCWVSSVAAIGWALRKLTPTRMMFSCAVIAYLIMIYFFVFAMPAGDAWRGEKEFAQQVRTLTASHPSELAFFTNQGPAFYLAMSEPIPEYERVADLSSAVAKGKVRWIVIRRRDIDRLKLMPVTIAASEPVYPWDQKEHKLNRMVLVEVRTSEPADSAHSRIGITTY
jgi:4-amino-4-deoxy-L-arabinose transferase-like glycosyltransferase